MKKRLLLMILSLMQAGPTQVLASEQTQAELQAKMKAQNEKYWAIYARQQEIALQAEEKALAECNINRYAFSFPAYDWKADREIVKDGTISIEWSGGCVEGKRDGRGILSWQIDSSLGKGWFPTHSVEGNFVKGKRVGMWCGSVLDGPRKFEGCQVLAGHGRPLIGKSFSGHYRKQPDGSWLEYDIGTPTGAMLKAGTLEALSTKVLADVMKGKGVLEGEVLVQSRSLDDLVRGSRITLAASTAPVSIKGKRVAVVFSSKTLTDLDRFKREREELISATSQLSGDKERERFIMATNPDRLLDMVAKVLRKHAKSVQPADDLAGLKKGLFDYAFVLDWKNVSRFDLVAKYYNSPQIISENVFCGQSFGGFLIGRDLKAVAQLPARTWKWDLGNYPDHEDIKEFARHYEVMWANSADAGMASTFSLLDTFLK